MIGMNDLFCILLFFFQHNFSITYTFYECFISLKFIQTIKAPLNHIASTFLLAEIITVFIW